MGTTEKIFNIQGELTIRYSNQLVSLPDAIQEKIDAYWEEQLSSGKKFKRGEVFTVTNIDVTQSSTEITVSKTDYAHYLYSQNVG